MGKTRTKDSTSLSANNELINKDEETNSDNDNTIASIQGLIEVSDNHFSEDDDSDGTQTKIRDFKNIADIPVPSTVQTKQHGKMYV